MAVSDEIDEHDAGEDKGEDEDREEYCVSWGEGDY